jgi:hypothetical protein
MDTLTDHDAAILDLEAQWWATAGGKERVIREQLGMTPVRYYQRLNQLLATEKALAYAAVTVNRMRRIADSRSQTRQTR